MLSISPGSNADNKVFESNSGGICIFLTSRLSFVLLETLWIGQERKWLVDALVVKSGSMSGMAMVLGVAIVVLVGSVLLYRLLRPRLVKYKAFRKVDGIVQGGVGGLKSIFRLKPRNIVLFVLYSCLIYLLYIMGGLFILRALPETGMLGFGAAFVVYLFGSVGMTISQGGLGAYPVLVWQALALYGVSETVGLATGWLLWGSQQVVLLVVGTVYIVYFSLKKRK